jgi:hypothetical protein
MKVMSNFAATVPFRKFTVTRKMVKVKVVKKKKKKNRRRRKKLIFMNANITMLTSQCLFNRHVCEKKKNFK